MKETLNFRVKGGRPRNYQAASRFVDACLAKGVVGFQLSELMDAEGLSRIAARDQLKRLMPRVVRVAPRQEFFLIVNATQSAIGSPPVSWWLDTYFRALNQPYYLALLSAAETYGSSHQAVQVTQVITDRPMRALSIGRLRLQFYVKARVGETPTGEIQRAYAPIKVSSPEATALDLLRYAHRLGGVGRAIQAISGMIIRFSKPSLALALSAEAEVANLQRLGFVFDKLGRQDFSKMIRDRLPDTLKVIYLERNRSTLPSGRFPVDRNWAVAVNADLTLS